MMIFDLDLNLEKIIPMDYYMGEIAIEGNQLYGICYNEPKDGGGYRFVTVDKKDLKKEPTTLLSFENAIIGRWTLGKSLMPCHDGVYVCLPFANDSRPVMGLSIWTQYVLDNFATVDEAVNELSLETFRIDDPDLPNGAKSTLHLSISDATGNSAIFEYINGNLIIHEGRECQIMTNSPTYDKQLTLNDYWKEIGGLVMLPGTNRASDRFVRASFYIQALPQTDNFRQAVAGVFSVMRNVSVHAGNDFPRNG